MMGSDNMPMYGMVLFCLFAVSVVVAGKVIFRRARSIEHWMERVNRRINEKTRGWLTGVTVDRYDEYIADLAKSNPLVTRTARLWCIRAWGLALALGASIVLILAVVTWVGAH